METVVIFNEQWQLAAEVSASESGELVHVSHFPGCNAEQWQAVQSKLDPVGGQVARFVAGLTLTERYTVVQSVTTQSPEYLDVVVFALHEAGFVAKAVPAGVVPLLLQLSYEGIRMEERRDAVGDLVNLSPEQVEQVTQVNSELVKLLKSTSVNKQVSGV